MDNLFLPCVAPEEWNQNFRTIWLQRNPWNECVIARWALGFEDRDGKFAKEFQTTFNSSFWELYLFACIKELGFSVDFSHHAPDFVVSKGADTICIEATITSHAAGSLAEWEGGVDLRTAENVNSKAIVEGAIPRLANTLSSKHRHFVNSYSTLDHVKGRPFVVAVAPFDQPMSYYQTDQAIRNVLYQYDLPIYEDIPEENRRIIFGHEYLDYFIKPNGTKIELGFFLDDRMKEVSAVIFSNLATWGKVRALSADPNPNVLFESKRFNEPGLKAHRRVQKKADYKESLLDGLHMFVNPNAEIPVTASMLNWPDVIYHTLDIDTDELGIPIDTASDGALFWRTVLTLDAHSDLEKLITEANQRLEED